MTDSTPMVGEAKDGDVDAISAFLWEAWRQAGPGAPGFAGATEEVIADVADPDLIRSRTGGPDHRMYIARSGDRIIGFASTRAETADTVELSGIVVLRETIGAGIGTRLLDATVAASKGYGFTTMIVSTETGNERAIRFYQHHGLDVIGTDLELVEETPVDVVTLTRGL
ncbi:MAG: GNAT family N-acetyltransferase [Acidimicrobiia bacterium]